MTLTDLASIGSFVSGVGVLASSARCKPVSVAASARQSLISRRQISDRLSGVSRFCGFVELPAQPAQPSLEY